jgi:hypothetical protein
MIESDWAVEGIWAAGNTRLAAPVTVYSHFLSTLEPDAVVVATQPVPGRAKGNHIYNDMLLIATFRKLRPVLYLNSLTCFAKGIRDHFLKPLTPSVVRWPKIDW